MRLMLRMRCAEAHEFDVARENGAVLGAAPCPECWRQAILIVHVYAVVPTLGDGLI